jgi:tetratricopeptide (TPR) repeat protein
MGIDEQPNQDFRLKLSSGETVSLHAMRDQRWWDGFLVGGALGAEIEAAASQIAELNKEWDRLKTTFHVPRVNLSIQGESGSQEGRKLMRILSLLEADQDLIPAEEDLGWLKQQQLYAVLGEVFDRKFRKGCDLFHAAMASSYWRKAGLYAQALASTERALEPATQSTDPARAACYVTRAATLKDLQRRNQALECLDLAQALGGSAEHIDMVRRALFD